MKTSLGIKNRNPLNIRYNPENRWLGQRGQNQGFCVFGSMDTGYRAALKLLCNYVRGGIRSVEDIITRWAPPSENDTKSYIEYVNSRLGGLKHIYNDGTLCLLCMVMARYESGVDFPEHLYLLGLCDKYNIHVIPQKDRHGSKH